MKEINSKNKIITLELYRLGVKPKGKGYAYLRECIKLLDSERNKTLVFNKDVYPHIAQIYSTTPGSVQRNMANCIDKIFLKADFKTLEKEFGDMVDYSNGKITLKQFVLHVAEKIRLIEA